MKRKRIDFDFKHVATDVKLKQGNKKDILTFAREKTRETLCRRLKFDCIAYCIPSLIRLFSRESSFASTYKLSTGDVLNASSESRNP
jgi:hypothetical protein